MMRFLKFLNLELVLKKYLNNDSDNLPYKNRLLGYFFLTLYLIFFLLLCLFLEYLITLLYNFPADAIIQWPLCFLFFIFVLAVIIYGIQIFVLGRKLISKDGETLISSKTQKYCLYLRSFEKEKGMDYFNRWEDALSGSMKYQIGPLIAIGQPGESFQQIGANRLYVKDGEIWQNKVVELIKNASLIVIGVGNSNGLMWEIEQVVSLSFPEKVTLFNLSFLDKKIERMEYDNFIKRTKTIFPCELPVYNKYQFIAFRENWQPYILPLPRINVLLNKLSRYTTLGTGDIWDIHVLMNKLVVNNFDKNGIKNSYIKVANLFITTFFIILNLLTISILIAVVILLLLFPVIK